jgi:hypothetical protein
MDFTRLRLNELAGLRWRSSELGTSDVICRETSGAEFGDGALVGVVSEL